MNKTQVTIGICVRNCENSLKEAIDSIINQDFPHEFMEVIFVDDGSEDKTALIIREYASKMGIRAKVFSIPKKGLGHARNIVIANAEGEFILWVDGDMVLLQNYVKKLTEFMRQHPEIGIAKGRMSLKSSANLLGSLEIYSRVVSKMVDYNSEKAFSKSLGTGGSIYRTEAAKEAGGFDEKIKGYGEDMDIEIRVKADGWSFGMVKAEFLDYERYGVIWNSLWNRYWNRGHHMHYFLHKNRGLLRHYRMLPSVAFFSGFLDAHVLFKLTRKKKVFLLPIPYLFKMTAYYFGFITSHFNSYEPHL